MRLIDADRLKDRLLHMYDHEKEVINSIWVLNTLVDTVDEQPIAYDVDAVIHRLDDASFLVATSKEFWNNPQNGKYVENVVRLSDAIEIVKAGANYDK